VFADVAESTRAIFDTAPPLADALAGRAPLTGADLA
jgi:hypothetical protein